MQLDVWRVQRPMPQAKQPDTRSPVARIASHSSPQSTPPLPAKSRSRLPRRRVFPPPDSSADPRSRPFLQPLPGAGTAAPVQAFTKNMGHDEAVVIQNSVKATSPPKDHPGIYPCLDWSTMQAYYGPGVLPPAFFNPGIACGHAPPPYVWGSQNMSLAAFGKPYTAIYPHAGGFLHPFMPLMVNPLSAEPAKSVSSKDNSLNKKLKEIDGTAGSTGSGHNTTIKPCLSTGSDFRVSGALSTEWPAKDDKESKRERRKQSNRESARRSRLRKQAETEELARKVELLTAENMSLRREINKLTESSQKLRMENSAMMEKLADSTSDQAQEASADHQTAAAPPSARAVKNFLSVMDGACASRGGSSSRRMEHGAPRLRQLLGSGPLAADAVAAS
ncbi:hypothetical protein U9M48_018199 [Paspalum notatum var. saurae]|uniref:BZIP domain-containing protein n=1 Tax=Paspalum notatum var. saurae TaxID=547442 RepID=A0AAQ3WQB1_PASNO